MPKTRKKPTNGSYTEYFITTSFPKLKKQVKIKELLDGEINEKHPDLI